jgi:hypothetical protein
MTDWRSFRGNIIPRDIIPTLINSAVMGQKKIHSRLEIGQYVRVRIDNPVVDKIDWMSAVVMDVQASYGMGLYYVLAFPTMSAGDYYVLSQNYPAIRDGFTTREESAETSGIYTEEDFEVFLESIREKKPPEFRPALSIVK